MAKPEVQTMELNPPIKVIGKHFKGDYAKSPQYIQEVQNDLKNEGIGFIPNKVFGIYYDNPQDIKPEELKSFQAVFPENDIDEGATSLTFLELKGKFLYVKVVGEPMNALMEGYGALFNHIQNDLVSLKSSAGYQVSTFEEGVITTEIYMELS